MGLSASQIRYLSLTGRKSEVEFNVQELTYQQTELAKMTQKIAEEYNEKLNNTTLVYNTYNDQGEEVQKTLTYDLITSSDEAGGLNMRITDENGNVVVPQLPSSTEYMRIKDTTTGEYSKLKSTEDFIRTYMLDISEEDYNTIKDYSFAALKEYWENSAYYNSEYIVNVETEIPSNMKGEEERYLIDANATDYKYLFDKLTSGEWKIEMRKADLSGEKNWEDIESFESLKIYQIMDTSDDDAAKAKYDSAMANINSQQKRLEYQLKQLDTEHQALVKELDSVLEVINNNIENSYNKFSS